MYTPASFAEHDLSRLHAFITANSFATLVSAGPRQPHRASEPIASHLPLLCDREAGSQGRLIGHMAAANPHWRELDGEPVLAIFSGPHAYISPAWCDTANAVPTWNYVAVHVYGSVQIERRPQQLEAIVRAYVEFYEATMPQPWSLDAAEPDFIAPLLKAIVGFTVEIERIEGTWKLSQNHPPQRREAVIRGLRSLGGDDRDRTAQLMADTLSSKSSGSGPQD